MLKGFRNFLMQGDLIIIAVGLVVALAFSTLIKAFTDSVVTPLINAAGGGLVAFTPETGGLALATKQQHGLRYDVLVDVDSGVGLQCGVVFRTPEPYRDLLASFGIDLPQRQDIGGWLLPAPVAYIVDRGGIIRWDFLDVDFTRRAEPADIVRALHAIR